MKNSSIDRRRFLKNAFMGGLGAAAYASSGLRMVSAASNSANDYKALVCVFLYGGNDSYNMFTPLSGEARLAYEDVRGELARPLGLEVYPTNRAFDGGLAFDQEMSALKTLFDQGRLAIQGNVGALIRPILDSNGNTIADVKKPHGLYAHNDSQQSWMRGADLHEKKGGWGGRMLDSWHDTNGIGQPEFTRSMSLGGANLWQRGELYQPYSVGIGGKISTEFLKGGNKLQDTRINAINNYRKTYTTTNHLEKAYFDLYGTAISNNEALIAQLAGIEDSTVTFPTSGLGQQLNTVSKLIEVGRARGVGRQVFFVGMGGFDTHKEQVGRHPGLMRSMSEAMASFYQDTEAKGIQDNVTSFTMSDFGRTLRSNGDGTDHGWAGHQMVLGGSVDGNKIYGDMPQQSTTTNLTPTTSNEQMFASLASWFGVESSELNNIFPNIQHFDNSINYFK